MKPPSILAKELELEETNNAYYHYIIETWINGQFSQIRKLYSKLQEHHKLELVGYLAEQNQTNLIQWLLTQEIQNEV